MIGRQAIFPSILALIALSWHSIGCARDVVDVAVLFAKAETDGRVGTARKTKPVKARPARTGEIITTIIAGEGMETKSPPAKPGDMVVRNLCRKTGNEKILVPSDKFALRYEGPTGPTGAGGWGSYRPHGIEMRYVVVRPSDGSFTFKAPWGEKMSANPGDVIVRDPHDIKDTYRIAAASFACTYEIIRPAQGR